jgi:hypothetical protein
MKDQGNILRVSHSVHVELDISSGGKDVNLLVVIPILLSLG